MVVVRAGCARRVLRFGCAGQVARVLPLRSFAGWGYAGCAGPAARAQGLVTTGSRLFPTASRFARQKRNGYLLVRAATHRCRGSCSCRSLHAVVVTLVRCQGAFAGTTSTSISWHTFSSIGASVGLGFKSVTVQAARGWPGGRAIRRCGYGTCGDHGTDKE